MFSPTKPAFLQAVKNGHLITWQGLTKQAINKHLKLTPATAMGHIYQRRQIISSTSKTQSLLTWKMQQSDPLIWEPKLILCMQLWSNRENSIQKSQENFR
jgi:hypothetical protein